MGALSQRDYEERKARQSEGRATDDDLRLIKHYEQREGYSCPGSSTETSSSETPRSDGKSETPDPSTARTTARRSKSGTASSIARSTGGRGKARS